MADDVFRHVLVNNLGHSVEITNFGATVLSIRMPDVDGNLDDVILGYDEVSDYAKGSMYFGATIGRFANRIGGAVFPLAGNQISVTANESGNHLHGGISGFDKKIWELVPGTQAKNKISLFYISPDGEEGFPGRLHVDVTFSLSDEDNFLIEYRAKSNMDTVINLTNHCYFNLSGGGSSVLGHAVRINADAFVVIDDAHIPTGEIRSVEGTPFDFRSAKHVGNDIGSGYEQIQKFGGYDHNFVLNGTGFRNVAALMYLALGRTVEVWTDRPGVQFYTGNSIEEGMIGRGGISYGKHSGICLETQNYPDAVNRDNFPSAILRKGDVYTTKTAYKFFANPYRQVYNRL